VILDVYCCVYIVCKLIQPTGCHTNKIIITHSVLSSIMRQTCADRSSETSYLHELERIITDTQHVVERLHGLRPVLRYNLDFC